MAAASHKGLGILQYYGHKEHLFLSWGLDSRLLLLGLYNDMRMPARILMELR